LTTPTGMHDKSTQKFYIINDKCGEYFFNRNWLSILYQDPTCINAPTLRFKS